MMNHISNDSLYLAEHGWLKSKFHFSFAEYQDKNNMHYGTLRVMNDDRISPYTGFGAHPHKDMEIITYVINGELTHQDSMGNKESLGRGAVQYLSAGTGIVHSEKNEGDEEVHFIQTWILPQENGLEPRYGSKIFESKERHNKWLHLMGNDAAIPIYQDANIYVSEVDKGKSLTFALETNRQLYAKIMEGEADINGILFKAGDAATVVDEDFNIVASQNVHILLIEMAKDRPS